MVRRAIQQDATRVACRSIDAARLALPPFSVEICCGSSTLKQCAARGRPCMQQKLMANQSPEKNKAAEALRQRRPSVERPRFSGRRWLLL
jgi:hypothetical protein